MLDFADPFGDSAKHGFIVYFLKGVAPQVAPLDLTNDQDHRHCVLFRRMHGDRRVAGARPAGNQRDAGTAGQTRVSDSHETRSAFMTAGD